MEARVCVNAPRLFFGDSVIRYNHVNGIFRFLCVRVFKTPSRTCTVHDLVARYEEENISLVFIALTFIAVFPFTMGV
jgi:hypothetical protein